jgi:hypothetical protein
MEVGEEGSAGCRSSERSRGAPEVKEERGDAATPEREACVGQRGGGAGREARAD